MAFLVRFQHEMKLDGSVQLVSLTQKLCFLYLSLNQPLLSFCSSSQKLFSKIIKQISSFILYFHRRKKTNRIYEDFKCYSRQFPASKDCRIQYFYLTLSRKTDMSLLKCSVIINIQLNGDRPFKKLVFNFKIQNFVCTKCQNIFFHV